MVTEPKKVWIQKPEDLFGTYGASEILPQFLEIIRRGQGEDIATKPVKDSPEIARDFEACRQALVSVGLLPLLIEIAVNQDVSDNAGASTNTSGQRDAGKGEIQRQFVSQAISYIPEASGSELAETLLGAWTAGIQDIVNSSTASEGTLVGSLGTYGASLIVLNQIGDTGTVTMNVPALHQRLNETHERLSNDLASIFDRQQWDERQWLKVAATAFDGILFSRYHYRIKLQDGDHPGSVAPVRDTTPEGILARFITSVVQELEEAYERIRGSDPELGELRSLLHRSCVLVVPFVRPWLGIQIPREPAMLRAGLAGEPGGCLFVLCCPKNLADEEPLDLKKAALLINWILNRAALIEARQQRVEQKTRDQVSSLHSLTTAIYRVRGILNEARFATSYDEAARLVNAAEWEAKRLDQLREAAVRAWKVKLLQEQPMDPSTTANGETLLKVVDAIVQESIRAAADMEPEKVVWDVSRCQDIENKPSWASVRRVRYDESYLHLILPEVLRNCVKHGNGQDSVSVEADTQTIEDKSYLVLTVSNGLKPSVNARLLQREISERRHDKLGLYQMTETARAWSLPVPKLSVHEIERSFSVRIYTAVKDIV